MDDLDKAQDHFEREEAMRRKYQPADVLEAEATGECLNCFEPVILLLVLWIKPQRCTDE